MVWPVVATTLAVSPVVPAAVHVPAAPAGNAVERATRAPPPTANPLSAATPLRTTRRPRAGRCGLAEGKKPWRACILDPLVSEPRHGINPCSRAHLAVDR